MAREKGFWQRQLISRRRALRGAAVAGSGLAALSLIGCGSDDNDSGDNASAQPKSELLDSTKGNPGGTIVVQFSSHPGALTLVRPSQTSHFAGYTHSGLLEFKNGRPFPGIDGSNPALDPDLATAMPEQPDGQTYIYKLSPAKFHSGRAVTSEDVAYSYDRYAHWQQSSTKSKWANWFDRVETPDAQTAVIKTKRLDADALSSTAGHRDAHILAKEHEEGPDATAKLMGTGPFLFDSDNPPTVTSFKRNPDYFKQPYPYFERVEVLGRSDSQKRIADLISGQTHAPFYMLPEDSEQVLKARPDIQKFVYGEPALSIHLRCDQPPFNDKRVRQAFSMTLDRAKIRDATSLGKGEPDQALTFLQKAWGFRKPSELGAAAKNWEFKPDDAKKLLSAAGFTGPVETTWSHWDSTRSGQSFVDSAVLAIAKWRELGIADVRQNVISATEYNTTLFLGYYEGMQHTPSGSQKSAQFAKDNFDAYWSPDSGPEPAPTRRVGYIHNKSLNTMLDKQVGLLKFDERKAAWKGIEELIADEMYKLQFSTSEIHYFADPKLRNIQRPWWAYGGAYPYVKYWWFA